MNILALSNFVPEQICDTKRFIRHPGRRSMNHYCGYAADFISQVMDDPQVDGCVLPRTCDSSRVMESYLAESGKFVHRLHIPARRDGAAKAYLAANVRKYQKAVECYYGVEFRDIPQRAEMVNRRNAAIAALYDSLAGVSYADYLDTIHELLQKPLAEQSVPESLSAHSGGKPVYLVGSTMCCAPLASAIENAGMNIVGDRLTESKRLFSAPPVSTDGDIYDNIADSMLQNQTSPTQNDFKAILEEDLKEIGHKGVRGVIFVTQKYCEPYDYLYYVYKRALDELNLPSLRLGLSSSTDGRQSDAAIEAFEDII